jgi:hypothetical protein
MSRKSLLPYALTAALTLASACSKDSNNSTGPTGSTLTTTEFDSMMEALGGVGIFFPTGVLGQPAMSRGLAAQQSQTVPIDQTNSCSHGGSTRVQGSFSVSASGSISGNLTQTASNCQESASDGTTFTFNTNPSFTLTFDISGINQTTGAFNMTLHDTGNFNWSKTGKSGGCSLNLNVTLAVSSAGAESGNATGSVCGRSVNETI